MGPWRLQCKLQGRNSQAMKRRRNMSNLWGYWELVTINLVRKHETPADEDCNEYNTNSTFALSANRYLGTISHWDPGHLRGLGPISILHRGFSQVRGAYSIGAHPEKRLSIFVIILVPFWVPNEFNFQGILEKVIDRDPGRPQKPIVGGEWGPTPFTIVHIGLI
jgi:hypothetical protein